MLGGLLLICLCFERAHFRVHFDLAWYQVAQYSRSRTVKCCDGFAASGNVWASSCSEWLVPVRRIAVIHARALSAALAAYGATVRLALESAATCGDAGTADLLTGVSRGVDKQLWLVEAHLHPGS